MPSTITPKPPYPLHPSIVPLIEPEYAAFYNAQLVNTQQVHLQPISTSRSSGTLIAGGGPPLPVGSVKDYKITRRASEGPAIPIRVFTPEGTRPAGGWPAVLWLHGGGWVLGNLDTENVVCTHLCKRAGAVVVTADYRLAPEHIFPAAVHDAWEAALWLHLVAPFQLAIDPVRIALGGSSAGANLAVVTAQRTLSPKHVNSLPNPFISLLLSVPVADNAASLNTNWSYRAYENTPALPMEKMMWYRRHYLPNESDWTHPEASPLMWEGDWGRLPRTLVLVGELDVLRAEGEALAARIKEGGAAVVCEVVKGCPHTFLVMDGVLEKGREALGKFCAELESVFGNVNGKERNDSVMV